MPFVSKAQKGFLYANHPEIAKKWQEHTPKGAKLPEHVKKEKTAQLKTILKTAIVAGPSQGVIPGIPGPMAIQPQTAQPAQGPAEPLQAISQLPGANDHPNAQSGSESPVGAPAGQPGASPQPAQPAQPAVPAQPLNQADAASMAVIAKMKPPSQQPPTMPKIGAFSKTAAVYFGLRQIAVRSVL